MQHDTLLEVRDGDPVYRSTTGGPPATPPSEQGFWVAEGTDTAPVAGDVAVGAEVPMVAMVIALLFVLAGLSLLLGVVLIAMPIRSISRRNS